MIEELKKSNVNVLQLQKSSLQPITPKMKEEIEQQEINLKSQPKAKTLEYLSEFAGKTIQQVNWSKKNVCPIYQCFKEFVSVQELKSHVEQEHPELVENNLFMDDNGNLVLKPEHLQ